MTSTFKMNVFGDLIEFLHMKPIKQGFAVLEREEIERRLLFKGEHYIPTRNMKPNLHLESPAPNIIATALLTLISCLKKNESSTFIDAKSSSLQAPDP